MGKTALRFVCWLMLLTVPLQVFAADTVGVLTSTGTVLVDHMAVPANTAVFSGSVLETSRASRAVLNGKGSVVVLNENSTLRLGPQLELQSGSVVVSSSNTVATQVDDVTITIAPGMHSKFIARKLPGELQVIAMEGRVYLFDGQETTPVPATKGVKVPLGTKGKKTITWLKNDDVGIAILVGAAVVAGVTVGIINANNAKPATTSAP